MTGAAAPLALRVGLGVDVHPFSEDPRRPLVLGGVTVPGAPGLAGHSDADVVCHALSDAVLGACALGDMGRHFPDTDPSLAGADSVKLLSQVVAMAATRGAQAVNADCTVMCERPALSGHVDAMARLVSGVLAAPVNVKATRAEGLGPIGQAEGIACLAVVLMTGLISP